MSGYANPTCDLRRFREQLYACMKRRSDALFELCDAILSAGTVTSPVHLTLAPAHRRGWGSFYAALSKGGLDEGALRDLLAGYLLGEEVGDRPRVFAVDQSVWPCCDAEASPERGYYHHPVTPPDSRSSPGELTSSSPSCASPAVPG